MKERKSERERDAEIFKSNRSVVTIEFWRFEYIYAALISQKTGVDLAHAKMVDEEDIAAFSAYKHVMT